MRSRRDFLKISGLGVAGATIAGSAITKVAKAAEKKDKIKNNDVEGQERTPTYCEVCFWKCAGWVVKNKDGEIQKIIGNDEDQHSRGRFCPRGTGGIGQYYDEDRLKKPMIRRGEPGNQKFEEVSWNEAFDFISKKLQVVSKKYGPETLALFSHMALLP
jgi:thiosulfate reductase/polysulfide reductase chain A